MKNIQVIDGADNCTYSIFAATDDEFAVIFDTLGSDIQFAEDLSDRAVEALDGLWKRPVLKADVVGIHGTLFYGFESKRQHFPGSKRECDWSKWALNDAHRRIYDAQS